MSDSADPLRDEALAFYRTLPTYEHHFNTMEFEVRKLASAWLLAGFGAIGFILQSQLGEAALGVRPLHLVVIVAALSQLGLFMLWMLDQVVYHGLLDAAFTTALHIERRFTEVPPLRSLMLRLSAPGGSGGRGSGMARYMKLFYLLPMAVFLLIATVATLFIAMQTSATAWPMAALSLALAVPPAWILRRSRLTERAKARNRARSDGESVATSYDDVIDRWQGSLEAGRP